MRQLLKFLNTTLTLILMTIVILAFVPSANAASLELKTYYPAPHGAYDRILLIPQQNLSSPCLVGTMIVEQNTGKLLYCYDLGNNLTNFEPMSNIWTQSGNNVYPTTTDTKPLIFVGMGTSATNFKLTLDHDGGILATGTFGSGTVTSYPINTFNKNAPARARLIWYPRRAAFRAIWDRYGVTDDSQIGDYSIAFGDSSLATNIASTVSGTFNSAQADYATIAGGTNNSITSKGKYSVITGGDSNSMSGQYSVISGTNQQVQGDYTVIGGGANNSTATSTNVTIAGGSNNTIQTGTIYSTIAGGSANTIMSQAFIYGRNVFSSSVIGGGQSNSVSAGLYMTIGGGKSNQMIAGGSFIGGGNQNSITSNDVANPFSAYDVIGGGSTNTIQQAEYSVLMGGNSNTISKDYSVILGGDSNNDSGLASLIAGGSSNNVSSDYSVIAAGSQNSISGTYSWAGGRNMNLTNTANRTFVWGYSVDPVSVTAADAFILAPGTAPGGITYYPKLSINETAPAGILSITLPPGSPSDFLAITSSNAAAAGDVFIIKNNGYVGIGNNNPQYPLQIGNIAGPSGILTVGGVWTTPSSRTFKDNIEPLDPKLALVNFKQLNPVNYNYKTDKNNHYVGFIAEDVPDLVAEESRKGLAPMPIAAVLTAVLKEQKKDLQVQDKTLEELDKELQNLKAELLNR